LPSSTWVSLKAISGSGAFYHSLAGKTLGLSKCYQKSRAGSAALQLIQLLLLDRLAYIRYWDEKVEQLNHAIKEIGLMTNMAGITADLDKFARIRSNFDHLTDLLSDMNALTPELHAVHGFSSLILEVERSLV